MEKKYNALAKYTQSLEQEIKKLNAAIQILLAEKAQWIQAKEMQREIIHQRLTTSNEKINVLGEEIQSLKAEIRMLRGEG